MFPRVPALVGHTPFLGRRRIGDMVALPRLPPVEAVSVNDIYRGHSCANSLPPSGTSASLPFGDVRML